MHAEHNKGRADTLLYKDKPLNLLKGLCVRGSSRPNKDCNILTPTLMAITAFLSRSPGCSTGGLGAQPLLEHYSHSSMIWAPIAPPGVLMAPSSWCWFSLQHLISNWFELPVHRVILLFYVHSIQTVDSQGYPPTSSTGCIELYYCFTPTQFNPSTVNVIPWHPRPDSPVIYTGTFLILTAWPGRRSIYIWPIHSAWPGAANMDLCEPGNESNEGVLRIPQSSSITEALSWDCLVSYPGHSLEEGLNPL